MNDYFLRFKKNSKYIDAIELAKRYHRDLAAPERYR